MDVIKYKSMRRIAVIISGIIYTAYTTYQIYSLGLWGLLPTTAILALYIYLYAYESKYAILFATMNQMYSHYFVQQLAKDHPQLFAKLGGKHEEQENG